ncbi:fibronectin type III domain-containing protein, partial [Paenibacillus agilis]|uniref:fibronectin type III domain-containing protein n=1 Tax=Paenibacillus agilis TaxID=3020863 RepID=UPI001649DBD4
MSNKANLYGYLALIVILSSVPIPNQANALANGALDGKGVSVTTSVYKNGVEASPRNMFNVMTTSAPQNFVVTKQTDDEVDFAWDGVQSPELDYYWVYVNGNKITDVRGKTSVNLSGFRPEEHKVYVTAVYKNGVESASSNVLTIDTTPIPKELTVRGQTATSVDLAWKEVPTPWKPSNAIDVSYYWVYVNGKRVADVHGKNEVTLTDMPTGQMNSIYITAVYSNGTESKPSNMIQMNATPAPQNLVVTKQNKRDAEFAWEAVQSPKLAHYSIYVNGKKNNKVANKTTIALSGFQPGKHSIYVTATYKNGDVSGVSNVVTIIVEGNVTTTSTPQNFVVTKQTDDEVDFAWDGVQSPELDYYWVYVNGNKITDVRGKTSVNLSGFRPEEHKVYVTAVYKNGVESAPSNVLTIDTTPIPKEFTVRGQTATSVDLSWKEVPTPWKPSNAIDVSYYWVYVNGKRVADVHGKNEVTLTDMPTGQMNSIYITAVYSNGTESKPSNTIQMNATPAPQNLVVTKQNKRDAEFAWEAVQSPELA